MGGILFQSIVFDINPWNLGRQKKVSIRLELGRLLGSLIQGGHHEAHFLIRAILSGLKGQGGSTFRAKGASSAYVGASTDASIAYVGASADST